MNRKIIKIFLPTLMILFIISNVLYAREVFEKGDALYRQGDFPFGSWILGHTGVYQFWEDKSEDADPDNLTKHLVVESKNGSGVIGNGNNFGNFLAGLPFWSVRTDESLTYKQRQTIINTASAQIGCRYHFFWGYKAPGRSFRCDGLVEYCYERAQAGSIQLLPPYGYSGIVPYDTWVILYPWGQMQRLAVRTEAEVEEVEIKGIEIDNHPAEIDEEGRYCLKGEVSIDTYTSDGIYGSGIARIEIWVGYPDDTLGSLPGKRIIESQQKYPIGIRDYFDWDTTTVDDGEYTLYAKAFDQAGNTKVSDPVEVIVDNVGEELHLVSVGYWALNSAIGGDFVNRGIFGLLFCRGYYSYCYDDYGDTITYRYEGYASLYKIDIPTDSDINNIGIVFRNRTSEYSWWVYKSTVYGNRPNDGYPPNVTAEVKIDYSLNSHPDFSTPIGEHNLLHEVIGGNVRYGGHSPSHRYTQSFLPSETFIKTIPIDNPEVESVWISIYASNMQSMAAQIPLPVEPDLEHYGWNIFVTGKYVVDSIYGY